ncbi:hypothetical protein LCGC14_1455660 [marine sediment metagenome]|uniref:Uncharacterized protein n=1 Tax=marine sediment metagenome TaxID=412755 RepID=A0A0F9MIG2_9ZZZZ
MNKEKEEELRAEVISDLSCIAENWDEGISQALMVGEFDYKYALTLTIDCLKYYVEAIIKLRCLINE